jgi:hypothetical protein
MSVVLVVIAATAVRKLSAAASQISAAHCANSAIADPATADVRPIATATDMHPTADAADVHRAATADARREGRACNS